MIETPCIAPPLFCPLLVPLLHCSQTTSLHALWHPSAKTHSLHTLLSAPLSAEGERSERQNGTIRTDSRNPEDKKKGKKQLFYSWCQIFSRMVQNARWQEEVKMKTKEKRDGKDSVRRLRESLKKGRIKGKTCEWRETRKWYGADLPFLIP